MQSPSLDTGGIAPTNFYTETPRVSQDEKSDHCTVTASNTPVNAGAREYDKLNANWGVNQPPSSEGLGELAEKSEAVTQQKFPSETPSSADSNKQTDNNFQLVGNPKPAIMEKVEQLKNSVLSQTDAFKTVVKDEGQIENAAKGRQERLNDTGKEAILARNSHRFAKAKTPMPMKELGEMRTDLYNKTNRFAQNQNISQESLASEVQKIREDAALSAALKSRNAARFSQANTSITRIPYKEIDKDLGNLMMQCDGLKTQSDIRKFKETKAKFDAKLKQAPFLTQAQTDHVTKEIKTIEERVNVLNLNISMLSYTPDTQGTAQNNPSPQVLANAFYLRTNLQTVVADLKNAISNDSERKNTLDFVDVLLNSGLHRGQINENKDNLVELLDKCIASEDPSIQERAQRLKVLVEIPPDPYVNAKTVDWSGGLSAADMTNIQTGNFKPGTDEYKALVKGSASTFKEFAAYGVAHTDYSEIPLQGGPTMPTMMFDRFNKMSALVDVCVQKNNDELLAAVKEYDILESHMKNIPTYKEVIDRSSKNLERVRQESLQEARMKMEFFCDTALELLSQEPRDFLSAYAIYSALNKSFNERLMKEIPPGSREGQFVSQEYKQKLELLDTILTADKSNKSLRAFYGDAIKANEATIASPHFYNTDIEFARRNAKEITVQRTDGDGEDKKVYSQTEFNIAELVTASDQVLSPLLKMQHSFIPPASMENNELDKHLHSANFLNNWNDEEAFYRNSQAIKPPPRK